MVIGIELTQVKGNLVELQCIMKFMSMGFECSTPYGNQAKYDILIDVGNEIIRVQCKKSHWVDDKKGIMFSTSSQTTNTKKTIRHKYTSDQIDYFATCWGENVYLVPVDECSTSKTLRIIPKTDSTPNNVCMAEDYLAENLLGHLSLYNNNDFEETVPNIVSQQNNEPKYKCMDCGCKIYRASSRCVKCHLEHLRKRRPSRDDLKDMIRHESFLSIGHKYKVSDNAVRKWCNGYGLPVKKSDINSYSEKKWLSV